MQGRSMERPRTNEGRYFYGHDFNMAVRIFSLGRRQMKAPALFEVSRLCHELYLQLCKMALQGAQPSFMLHRLRGCRLYGQKDNSLRRLPKKNLTINVVKNCTYFSRDSPAKLLLVRLNRSPPCLAWNRGGRGTTQPWLCG